MQGNYTYGGTYQYHWNATMTKRAVIFDGYCIQAAIGAAATGESNADYGTVSNKSKKSASLWPFVVGIDNNQESISKDEISKESFDTADGGGCARCGSGRQFSLRQSKSGKGSRKSHES